MGAENILAEFLHISKSFPGVRALSDISLDLKQGEVHVLIGENGAGKSTLMKVLSGAYSADEGKLLIGGQEIGQNSLALSEKLGVAMIYQELNLIPELSIMQNIFLGHELKKGLVLDTKEMYRITKETLGMLHLDIDPNILVKELGAGVRQMVEIAKALIKNSKILVLDEPTSSLSDSEIQELFSIISMLKKKGVGMFYISHRLEELYEVGDRVSIMRDGCLVGTYLATELSMDKMIELIAGREISELYPRRRNVEIGEEILRVEHLTGEKFNDVSIHVRAGEIVGLSGLVGAGRTELARAIFGVDEYTAGSVLLEGKPVRKKRTSSAVRSGIGLLPEDRKVQGLSLNYTIRQNMVVANLDTMNPRGVTNRLKEKKVCEEYVEKLDIATPTIEKPAGFLSGGTQQKVVIAKWLMANLKLFIFDEPTRGIDVGAKSEIYNLMDQLVHQGAAVLMISSDLPEILGMSDRIYVMSAGRITGELNYQEATQEKVLTYAYGQDGRKEADSDG